MGKLAVLFLSLILQIGTGCASDVVVTGCDACHSEATCMKLEEQGDFTSSTTFSCLCREGFVGDGINCYDVKECEGDSSCCMAGYKWSPKQGCVDVDECSLTPSPCGATKLCRNTQGSFECVNYPALHPRVSQFWCNHRMCDHGMDCIKENGVSRCADPCERHTILDESWRSTDYKYTGKAKCDRNVDWQGWYRLYLNGTNAQIPDTCVEQSMCGTQGPMFINEGHPTHSIYIERRNVCVHYKSSCCRYTSPDIHVKRCYGQFYIYRLVKPKGCDFAYCAEPSPDSTTTPVPSTTTATTTPIPTTTTPIPTTTTPIPTTTTTIPTTTTAIPTTTTTIPTTTTTIPTTTTTIPTTTTAIPTTTTTIPTTTTTIPTTTTTIPTTTTTIPTTTTTIPTTTTAIPTTTTTVSTTTSTTTPEVLDPEIQIDQFICGQDKIQVTLNMGTVSSSGLDPLSGHLVDRDCIRSKVQTNIVWYEVEARGAVCGNTRRTNSTHVIYTNSLFLYAFKNNSFHAPASLPFSCVYPLDIDIELNADLNPLVPTGGILASGGAPKALMSLYRDSSYSSTYMSGSVSLPMGHPLYVGVFVEENDLSFVTVLDSCYLTYTSNPNDPMRHPLIHNKCSTDRQQVSVVESGTSLRARFSALFFVPEGQYKRVYLHCHLKLCNSSPCVPVCSGRARRSVSTDVAMRPLTVGPITWGTN